MVEIKGTDRVARLAQMLAASEETNDEAAEDFDAFKDTADDIHDLRKMRAGGWRRSMMSNLLHGARKAHEQAAKIAASKDSNNLHAIKSSQDAAKANLLRMVQGLNPPPEIVDSPEFQELLEFLKPPAQKRAAQSYAQGSAMRGSIKSQVMLQQVESAIEQASRKAGKKMMELQAGLGQGSNNFGGLDLARMARYLKRKLKKRKGDVAVDADGNILITEGESIEEVRALQSEMEIFCAKALETMRTIREEIVPKWVPDQQPWLTQESDRQVYDIILAVIPQELFEQTESYGAMQNLRAGEEVFTLRAADRLVDAAARKK